MEYSTIHLVIVMLGGCASNGSICVRVLGGSLPLSVWHSGQLLCGSVPDAPLPAAPPACLDDPALHLSLPIPPRTPPLARQLHELLRPHSRNCTQVTQTHIVTHSFLDIQAILVGSVILIHFRQTQKST